MARSPWVKSGPMSVPVVLALSASYSVNGTLAPVPLGTLNGDWAQYGGAAVAAWAAGGAASATRERRAEGGDGGRGQRGQPRPGSCRGLRAGRSVTKGHRVHAFP